MRWYWVTGRSTRAGRLTASKPTSPKPYPGPRRSPTSSHGKCCHSPASPSAGPRRRCPPPVPRRRIFRSQITNGGELHEFPLKAPRAKPAYPTTPTTASAPTRIQTGRPSFVIVQASNVGLAARRTMPIRRSRFRIVRSLPQRRLRVRCRPTSLQTLTRDEGLGKELDQASLCSVALPSRTCVTGARA